MSISFIAKGTGLKRRAVCRAVERLVTKRLIVREESIIRLNKNYDEWVVTKRSPSVQTDTPPVSKRRTEVVTKRSPNKERIKETPDSKEIISIATPSEGFADSGAEINKILSHFQMKLNPTLNYGNKTQRDAVKQLLRILGADKLLRTIDYAASVQSEQFAPIITTPYQLKEKMAQLTSYYQKQTNKAPLVASI